MKNLIQFIVFVALYSQTAYSQVAFEIKGQGLEPEKVREFWTLSIGVLDELPKTLKESLPQSINLEIKDLKSVGKDITVMDCSFKKDQDYYSQYDNKSKSIIFDSSLFESALNKKDNQDCSGKEFAKRSLVYSLIQASIFHNAKEYKKIDKCYREYINRFRSGKLSLNATKELISPSCQGKVFKENSHLAFSKEYFQKAFIPRNFTEWNSNESIIKDFSTELSRFILGPDYACRRPSLNSLFSKTYKVEHKECNKNYQVLLDMFPFEKRNLNPKLLKSVEIVNVKAGSSLKDRSKLYIKMNLCESESSCYGRYHNIWIGFRESVEDLLLSVEGRAGFYARAFVADDLVISSELNTIQLKEFETHELKLNKEEKVDFATRVLEMVWNKRSYFQFLSHNNLLEINDVISSVFKDLKSKDYYSSNYEFIQNLKDQNFITKSKISKAKRNEIEKNYDYLKSMMFKVKENVPPNLEDFLAMKLENQLSLYQLWVQDTRILASNAEYSLLIRKRDQLRFIQAYSGLMNHSMKYKFLKRRDDLTDFLLQNTVDSKLLPKEFFFKKDKAKFGIPYQSEMIGLSDYLSLRDKNQESIELVIGKLANDEIEGNQSLKKQIRPLYDSGMDLISTQKYLKDKFEPEATNSYYLFTKALVSYMKKELASEYRKNFKTLEIAMVDSKKLKRFKKKLKLDTFHEKELSDNKFRYFIKEHLEANRDMKVLEDRF